MKRSIAYQWPVLALLCLWLAVSVCLPAMAADDAYKLGAGDKLKISVYEEPDLSGEFEIDSSGQLAMPLIGEVVARGLSPRKLEQLLQKKLSEGYLVQPRVNLEVANFRHFFIMGEVKSPGSYPYVSDLNVMNAVALAGGFTYRAKTDKVTINRDGESFDARPDVAVMPGDTLQIEERLF